jgi:predicted transcriptional regulator
MRVLAKEWTPTDVFEVLADEYVRAILLTTNIQKRSVADLTNHVDTSQSSLYRRVDLLVEYNLLQEQTKVDDEGHHYAVYQPEFSTIDIQLESNSLIVQIDSSGTDEAQHVEHWTE